MPVIEHGLITNPVLRIDAAADGWAGRVRDAIGDLADGLKHAHVWHMLALQEIRQRYRRSLIGPLWITISTGVLVGAMGPLYGSLFGHSLAAYFPHLAVSFVIWLLIANLLNEACVVFIGAEGVIKQIRMPLSIHVYRFVWKNLLVFLHHVILIVAVLAIFRPQLGWNVLLAPVGLLLLALNAVWIALFLGVVCARYRDIPLIVQNIVQVLFFLTPVLWRPRDLGPALQWAAEVNPLHHFLEVVRSPLLGSSPTWINLLVVALTTVSGFAMGLAFFARFRSRIAYWV